MADRGNEPKSVTIPAWIFWPVIAVLLGLGGGGAWGITQGNGKGAQIQTDVALNSVRIEELHRAVAEIKQGQRDLIRKVDRLIELQIRGRRGVRASIPETER